MYPTDAYELIKKDGAVGKVYFRIFTRKCFELLAV